AVTVLVIRRSFKQDRADALRDATADLALDDGGVDERAAIRGDDVPLHGHDAGLDGDLDNGAVTAAGPSSFAAVERGLDFEIGVHVLAELARCRAPRDLAHRDGTRWVTAHPDVAVGDLEVPDACLHDMRREIEHLGLEL